ncbi:PITH domain-containing protein [Hypoxylon sp. NC1633]|nr:PITH domain-containing protein [Hypoxylon sp. NC1633]
MSHCHNEHQAHGGHDGHDHHDHEHDHSDDITPALQHSLYQHIKFDEINTLNEASIDSGKAIVKKTWAERLDLEPELASDADEQILMTVPFTGQVKLHSILLRTSPSDSAPRTLKVYINRDDIDFETAEELAPTQTLELAQTTEVQELPVKRALFGKWMQLGRAPSQILYEAAANPNDHPVKQSNVNRLGREID